MDHLHLASALDHHHTTTDIHHQTHTIQSHTHHNDHTSHHNHHEQHHHDHHYQIGGHLDKHHHYNIMGLEIDTEADIGIGGSLSFDWSSTK
jgi:hypothetical protein